MHEATMQGMLRSLRQLALIAMIARALLPAGWMPSADPAAPFTICTVNGALEHLPGNNSGDNRAPASHHAPCPFATAPHLAGAPALPALFAPLAVAHAAYISSSNTPTLAARFTPGSPRAPPLNA